MPCSHMINFIYQPPSIFLCNIEKLRGTKEIDYTKSWVAIILYSPIQQLMRRMWSPLVATIVTISSVKSASVGQVNRLPLSALKLSRGFIVSRPVRSCIYCFTHPGHIFDLMYLIYYPNSNTEEPKLVLNSRAGFSQTTCLIQPIILISNVISIVYEHAAQVIKQAINNWYITLYPRYHYGQACNHCGTAIGM